MKALLSGKNLQGSTLKRGVSTLEILIAFAVLMLSLTAVIGVLFGTQSVFVDTETNSEALYKAHAALEEERALSRQDFLAVSTTPSTVELVGSLSYTKKMTVVDLTPCKKQATSTITWINEGRPQK
ncbi:MAG: hypothetical protein G01um101456_225, partial [Parcubacteria group bacterium Gr01-1014_56]